MTQNWALSIWDAMKHIVTEIILPAFGVLSSIPIGFGNASVLDFMIGLIVIATAASFFWRSGAATAGIASAKMQSAKSESVYQSRLKDFKDSQRAQSLSNSMGGNAGKAQYWSKK